MNHTSRFGDAFTQSLLPASMLSASNDASQRHANLSNALYLAGDIQDGDPNDYPGGDPYPYGDAYPYGDINQQQGLINAYATTIGDTYGQGGLHLKQRWQNLPMAAKLGIGIPAAAAAGYGLFKGGSAIYHALHNKHQANLAHRHQLDQAAHNAIANNEIAKGVYARRHLNKLEHSQLMPFYQTTGVSLIKYPLAPTRMFPVNDIAWCLQQQANTSPFVAETVNYSVVGGNYQMVFTGPAEGLYFPFIYVIIGAADLTAPKGIVFNVSGTIPLVGGGSCDLTTVPFTFQLGEKNYARICLVPFLPIALDPTFKSGFTDSTHPITITVSSSIPAPVAVSLTVPGTKHPAIIALRNSLVGH